VAPDAGDNIIKVSIAVNTIDKGFFIKLNIVIYSI